MKLKVKYERLQLDAKIPTKSNDEDAGWDFYCIADLDWTHYSYNDDSKKFVNIDDDPHIILQPGEGYIFRTGLAIEIPKGWCLVFFDRSGMGAVKRIHVSAGVIDCTYRGELKIALNNLHQNNPWVIKPGDKIIQGLFIPVPEVEWTEKTLSKTARGAKGFGSSGS